MAHIRTYSEENERSHADREQISELDKIILENCQMKGTTTGI